MPKKLTILLVLLLLVPGVMWLTWILTPNSKFVGIIVDKTVLTPQAQEHSSLNWVLNYERYTKTPTRAYKADKDYFGFFPLEEETYVIKGLERFNSRQLTQLTEDADFIYITDTYGIYNNEWFKQGGQAERSGMLYGGLSENDLQVLKLMKEKNKLILTEFNTIGSPTSWETRKEFEKLFSLKWTGWTGRYFENLNINTNKELPKWLITGYKKSHNNEWPFKKAGIAFVNNNNNEVVILEINRHLEDAMPYILSTRDGQKEFSLPPEIKYPFWFDIMEIDTRVNDAVSSFDIRVNEDGRNELKKYGIPETFPAVTRHIGEDNPFYYFSGDFSDNAVSLNTSYFKGIGFFKNFFYDESAPEERDSFFWKFYRPMLLSIFKNYHNK